MHTIIVVERMTKGGLVERVSGLLANGMSPRMRDEGTEGAGGLAVAVAYTHNAVALSLKANQNAAKENRSKQQWATATSSRSTNNTSNKQQ